MPYTHETLATPGLYDTLDQLERSDRTAYPEDELLALMRRAGVAEPEAASSDLSAQGLLHTYPRGLGISELGMRTVLLLRAINGGDLAEIWRRLAGSEGLPAYALVREGMTRRFLESLNDRPGYARLYFCSPWIRLDERNERLLAHAMATRHRASSEPQLIVITRPVEGTRDEAPAATAPFSELGATIFLHPRLHSKIYIRDPGVGGGFQMAIVGSQNLTRSNYLELGIQVNADGQLITQLIRYLWDISTECEEA